MRRHAWLSTFLFLALPVAHGSAQAPPGMRLTVDIDVAATTMRGDTTRVSFVLTNRPTSAEPLFMFNVDAPSSATWNPKPAANWVVEDFVFDRILARERTIVGWTALGSAQVAPGATSPTLSFEAVGLAGLVSAWVTGYAPPPLAPPPSPDSLMIDTLPEPPLPDLLESSLKSTTVGVTPFPSGMTTAGLVTRLDSLTRRACGDLVWISSSATCSTLRSHLSTASGALAANNDGDARTAVLRYIGDLDSSRFPPVGTPTVNGSAYWLLRPNATFVLGRIPEP